MQRVEHSHVDGRADQAQQTKYCETKATNDDEVNSGSGSFKGGSGLRDDFVEERNSRQIQVEDALVGNNRRRKLDVLWQQCVRVD